MTRLFRQCNIFFPGFCTLRKCNWSSFLRFERSNDGALQRVAVLLDDVPEPVREKFRQRKDVASPMWSDVFSDEKFWRGRWGCGGRESPFFKRGSPFPRLSLLPYQTKKPPAFAGGFLSVILFAQVGGAVVFLDGEVFSGGDAGAVHLALVPLKDHAVPGVA